MAAQLPNLTPTLGYPSSEWVPLLREISFITQANPCVITTTTNHGFQDGIIVRIFLPNPSMGMQSLNERLFKATILSPTTFSIPVDTRNFEPFTNVIGQSAQVLPSGEISTTLQNVMRNVTTVYPS